MFIFEERSLGAVLAALAIALLVGVAAPLITSGWTPQATDTATADPTRRFANQHPRIHALTLWRG
jgi:hypothetical protein